MKSLTFPRQVWRWYAFALVVLLLDQISKQWVSAALTYGEPVVFTPFFNFTLLHNPGAAFSFLADAGGWQRWFFTVLALGVSVVLVIWLAKVCVAKPLEALALALILGGALGNVYDRLMLGYVVDFIVVHYRDYYFPAFNIADSAITVGAFLLIFDMLFSKENPSHD
ncbi:signal peptidase II [Marinimicrobium sp. ABcell2]|uniref:signal peptidase II n=1 Tax=Marinimicrobium sp. ABcell2 TaxID=3069751 RepID=UPI0027B5E39A|nr:signal peptidase II [Marinimicrobium sp. ABcell2]MDQ2078128.1 signal peptidase II [Marinimicrobium sp. ABcell2]